MVVGRMKAVKKSNWPLLFC